MIKRDKCLYFKRGYKYQTTRDFHIKLDVVPIAPIGLPFVSMDMDGTTIIYRGYSWNGPSGPTWDTLDSMTGSLVHDLIYQLIRLGLIDPKYKEYADRLFHDLCTEDGMMPLRADIWQWAVMAFGRSATRPSAEPVEEVAP